MLFSFIVEPLRTQCSARKKNRKHVCETIYVTEKWKVKKKSLFSIPLLLWGIKLLVSDLKTFFFFFRITTSSFLLLMHFHLSKQCWERISWERVRLRLSELEQPQLFLPVLQTVKVEAKVHLTRGTACPPLCREGTKLQGMSSSSLCSFMPAVWDWPGLCAQRTADPLHLDLENLELYLENSFWSAV